jgi:hypothetical protein
MQYYNLSYSNKHDMIETQISIYPIRNFQKIQNEKYLLLHADKSQKYIILKTDKNQIIIKYDSIFSYKFSHIDNEYILYLELKKIQIDNKEYTNKIISIKVNGNDFFDLVNTSLSKNIKNFTLNSINLPVWAIVCAEYNCPYNVYLRYIISFLIIFLPISSAIFNMLYIYKNVFLINSIMNNTYRMFYNIISNYYIANYLSLISNNEIVLCFSALSKLLYLIFSNLFLIFLLIIQKIYESHVGQSFLYPIFATLTWPVIYALHKLYDVFINNSFMLNIIFLTRELYSLFCEFWNMIYLCGKTFYQILSKNKKEENAAAANYILTMIKTFYYHVFKDVKYLYDLAYNIITYGGVFVHKRIKIIIFTIIIIKLLLDFVY